MESYPLPHTGQTVHLALWSVRNAAQLRQRLVAASQLPADEEGERERAAVDFAFVDAKMLTSRLHLLTAVQQALLARADNALKTKTLHSEVLWMLEPGSNISDSLKHFGLSPSTSYLALVHIAPLLPEGDGARRANGDILRKMEAIVEGELRSLDELGRLPDGGTDEKALRKVYKLNQDLAVRDLEPGSLEASQVLDRLVTSQVALKVAM
ncbi:hypothetical protein JCM10296v2_002916 [Rhodotorula toruloides]